LKKAVFLFPPPACTVTIQKACTMKRLEKDFDVSKFYFYYGPSHLLNTRSLVFCIYLDARGPEADFYSPTVYREFPEIQHHKDSTVIDLFVKTLLQVLRMKRDLFIKEFAVKEEGENYQVAIEFLDENTAEDAVHMVSDWFKSMNQGKESRFNFQKKFKTLIHRFDESLAANPLQYAMMDTAVKEDVPFFFLQEEDQLQWGYGIKQSRTSSGMFHTDSIVDRAFTRNNESISNFLMMGGFPTPFTQKCHSEQEVLNEADKMGYPVVLKPVDSCATLRSFANIDSHKALKKTFSKYRKYYARSERPFSGILLQQHITGMEYCLLVVGGRYAATCNDLGDIFPEIHPDNKLLVENLASYFTIRSLGVRVLADDLGRSWREGNFGIINLVTSPELCFDDVAPPGLLENIARQMIHSHFPRPENARIPIIAGNNISQELALKICRKAREHQKGLFTAALPQEGIFFNDQFFFKNPSHEQNVKLLLRHPRTGLAVIAPHREQIYESGFFHEGADLIILQEPNWAEESLKELLLPGGWLVNVQPNCLEISSRGKKEKAIAFNTDAEMQEKLLDWINSLLPELLKKYET
jgi:glutathione synthase/RimK-type ligase-like ATP-grasp enzyme